MRCGEHVPRKIRLCRLRWKRTRPRPSDTRFSRSWLGRKQQVGYAVREHLPAEEVKLGQLIADCKLVMEEMDLIEAARADRSQSVTVQQGHNSR